MSVTRDAKALPGIFIYKEEVNKRVKHYQQSKLPLLTQAIGKPDTTSGWYSLAQFEELVREMYYLNADGLRMYFGAYPDNDPLYANQLCLIFVPTRYDPETRRNKDIIIDDELNFQKRECVLLIAENMIAPIHINLS
jgi:hypothetical protein